MKDMVKKYLPYAAIIFGIFMLVPLIFLSDGMKIFWPVAYYFVFPATAILCSAAFCAKYGLDFLFTLIAPIVYLPSMLIYNNGFNITNIILLVSYLVAGIFGLFIGDIALGDKRRLKEEAEKAEAEEMMLEAKRRDEMQKELMANEEPVAVKKEKSPLPVDNDDFDYDKYTSDIDKTPIKSTEDEIDDILNEISSRND